MKKLTIISVLICGVLLIVSSGFKYRIAEESNLVTQDKDAEKILGTPMNVEPNANKVLLFKNFKLEKGFEYIVSVTGKVKPYLDSHVWGNCQENSIERRFKCSILITDPFDSNNVIQSTDIPEMYAFAPHFPDFQNCCLGFEQFQVQFAFDSVPKNKFYQIFFVNSGSEIKYHHECPPSNQNGGFVFPVTVSSDTKIEILSLME